jgi:hypothetical protein
MPGKETPGEAASIILPRNNGNKLVVNAESAIHINPAMNMPLYGFKYLKSIRACRRFSLLILAFCVLPSKEVERCRVAVAIKVVSYKLWVLKKDENAS